MSKKECKCGKKAEFVIDLRLDEIRLLGLPMMYERLQRNICRECYNKIKEILHG